MRVTRQNDRLTLTFNFLESRVLQRVLQTIHRNYSIKPGQIHPKVAAVWYSTRGCEKAGMSAEETSQWIEHLHQDKGSRAALLEDWSSQLAVPESKQARIRVSLGHASDLMMALNDHRLWLAARHDIGQAEMDVRSIEGLASLKPTQQAALQEIHFLAWTIEEILRALRGSERNTEPASS